MADDVSKSPGIQPHQEVPEAEQILGVAAHSTPMPEIDPKWEPYYRKLLQVRDYIIDQETDLEAKARDIQPKYLQHEPADVSAQDVERDYELAKVSADQELLSEIEEALDRIEAGRYGICELTGKEIPRERLDAVPWTRFTVEAETQIEQQGGGMTPYLEPAEPLNEQGAQAGQR
jgi:RNA polymerase-binding protein DksA